YNPWGKILMSVGVLQMMIQVPSFLARAQISPMSDFITAGLITGGLLKMFGWLGNTAKNRVGQAASYFTGDKFGARGLAQTSKTGLDNWPQQAGDPQLVKNLKDASKAGRTPPPDKKKNQGAAIPTDANGKPLNTPLNDKDAAQKAAEEAAKG